MNTVARIPAIVNQAGRRVPAGEVAYFIHNIARPAVVEITTGKFQPIEVLADGLTTALIVGEEWVSPFGNLTTRVQEDGGHDWLFITVDGRGNADCEVQVLASEVMSYLADVFLSVCRAEDAKLRVEEMRRVPDRDVEPLVRPRRDGEDA
ncbi:hypothetical protein GCM10010399_43850 [Dactylosporangium fulvum]|uniref:Uncharacterized protein n=1 Tax=Dactylosporangium fulvum TaxID=53359 RepID=A0ABY5WB85_9ACTN|nr:hypothetical protein [Dactylosporangium fulvum]UWP85948.1 hypothetical protein Dfulv_17515 [Dactylosporangium fulvum]